MGQYENLKVAGESITLPGVAQLRKEIGEQVNHLRDFHSRIRRFVNGSQSEDSRAFFQDLGKCAEIVTELTRYSRGSLPFELRKLHERACTVIRKIGPLLAPEIARQLEQVGQGSSERLDALRIALPALICFCSGGTKLLESDKTQRALDQISGCVASVIGGSSKDYPNSCFSKLSDSEQLKFLTLIQSFLEWCESGDPQSWSSAIKALRHETVDRIATQYPVSKAVLSLHHVCEEAVGSANTLNSLWASLADDGIGKGQFIQLITAGRHDSVDNVHSCRPVHFYTDRNRTHRYRLVDVDNREFFFYVKEVDSPELAALENLRSTGRGPTFLAGQMAREGGKGKQIIVVMPHKGVSLKELVTSQGLSIDMAHKIGVALAEMWNAKVVHGDLDGFDRHIWINGNSDQGEQKVFFIDFSHTKGNPQIADRASDFLKVFVGLREMTKDSIEDILSGSREGGKPIWQEVTAAFVKGVQDGGYSLADLGLTSEVTDSRMIFAAPSIEQDEGNLLTLRANTRRYMALVAEADAVLDRGNAVEALALRSRAAVLANSKAILFPDKFGNHNASIIKALTDLCEINSAGLLVYPDTTEAGTLSPGSDTRKPFPSDDYHHYKSLPKDIFTSPDAKETLRQIFRQCSFIGKHIPDFSDKINHQSGRILNMAGRGILRLDYSSSSYSDYQRLNLYFNESDGALRAVVVDPGYGHGWNCQFATDAQFVELVRSQYTSMIMSFILSPEYGAWSGDLARNRP